ncbi:VWA domain-containing protein [Candidatus Pacearchaeota archaeon]|nr:VWA domain-containing protein [Candidatus Pacearchaeota archaeon]
MKKGMKLSINFKKGQASVITVILMILIILVFIVVIWNILMIMVNMSRDETEARSRLMDVSFVMGKPIGNLNYPVNNILEINLRRGPGKVKSTEVNYSKVIQVTSTITQYPNISLISVIDLSGSMGDGSGSYGVFGVCNADPLDICCVSNNCSIQSGCNTCNGNFIGDECILISTNSCCRTSDCYKDSNCTACGGTYSNGPHCEISNMEVGCNYREDECINDCNGIWRSKLDITQEANTIFINDIFNKTPDSEFGIVGFFESIRVSVIPTDDTNSLINTINNGLNANGGTNICIGLEEAINLLSASQNDHKVIVLMSDGKTNYNCDGDGDSSPNTNSKNSAIAQAVIAKQENITIFTIGLGSDVDDITLRNISDTTGGNFSLAVVTNLDQIYTGISNIIEDQIQNKIKRDTIEIIHGQYMKAIVYGESGKYVDFPISDYPLPMESKNIKINTGGMTNIYKIEIYMVVFTDGGKEINTLIDSWSK